MKTRRILLDENLILDLLLDRPTPTRHGEFVWELVKKRQIAGYTTDLTLRNVLTYVNCLNSADAARQVVAGLSQVLQCISIDKVILQKATQIEIEFPCAIQLAAANQWELDGIVSNRWLAYHNADDDMSIFTPGQLVAEYFDSVEDFKLEEHRKILEVQISAPTFGGLDQRVATTAIRLECIEVQCANGSPTATVALQALTGELCREQASGVGPVDAAYKAIGRAVKQLIDLPDFQVVDYRSQATTAESEVSAMILLQVGNLLYPGRGFHTDVVLASVYAYMDALGYLFYCDAEL